MSNTLHNTIRTMNRLRKEAQQQIKSNPTHALALLERAYAMANRVPFSTHAVFIAKGRILHVLAYCYHRENQLDTALLYVAQAVELFKKTVAINDYVRAVNLMQVIHHNRGEYEVALELLQPCVQLEEKIDRPLVGKIYGNIGILLATLGGPEKAMPYFRQALFIAEESKNYIGVCLTHINIAMSYTFAGNMLFALEWLLRAVSVAEKCKVDKERTMGKLCMHIGNTLRLLGSYDQALTYFLHSLALFEKHGSCMEVGYVYQYIGFFYLDRKEYNLAKMHLARVLNIHTGRDGAQQTKVGSILALAQVELALGNTDIAHKHALEALRIIEATNDRQRKNSVLVIIAEVYAKQKEYMAARRHYQQILENGGNEVDDIQVRVQVHMSIGRTLICQQHYKEALEYLHTALALLEQTNAKPLLLSVYQALAEAYEGMGDTTRALEYFKFFYELEKQIFNEKSEQNIQVLKILHQTEQLEKENALQKRENKQLQHSVEQTQQALAVQALHLAQQTDLLQKAKGEIATLLAQQIPTLQQEVRSSREMLVDSIPCTGRQRASAKEKTLLHVTKTLVAIEQDTLPLVQQCLQSIGSKFDSTLLSQGMWFVFEQQFGQLHSGFMETLVQRYPQLSATEVKVCALLKMNMSSKEIGHALNVSLRSVETYRYNIRKKLGLATQDSLVQYLAELS